MSLPTVFHFIAFFIGIVVFSIGVAAVLQPEAMSKKFGIYVNGPALPYVVSAGIRDVFIGLIIFILVYRQDWTTLGAVNLCIAVVAFSDFLVVQKHGDKKSSLVHLFAAIAEIVFGILLIQN